MNRKKVLDILFVLGLLGAGAFLTIGTLAVILAVLTLLVSG